MQISLRTLFRTWREFRVRSGPSSSSTTVATTVQDRAVQAHVDWLMPLTEAQFRNSLEQLWRVLRNSLEELWLDVGVHLMHTWAIAGMCMSLKHVKICSHFGACVRWNRPERRPEKQWKWYDAGNWVYATVWHLLRKTARFLGELPADGPLHKRAERLHRAMLHAQDRWQRAFSLPRSWELLGDLVELALARGYFEPSLEPIVFFLSQVACIVQDVWFMLQNLANEKLPYISPDVFADMLLLARGGHGTADWQAFHHHAELSAGVRRSAPAPPSRPPPH